MLYEEVMSGVLYIYGMSFLDITLTFYQFILFEKKNINYKKVELNPIIKKIVGNNISAVKYLITIILIQTMITIALYALNFNLLFIGIFVGVLFMVNITHFVNIKRIKKNWNNKKYWETMKIYFGE